ncbi:hypothetical protein SDC9_195905 [bioreactor metagenome]|uniref:Uncharacterized protein n=1 Tax=bioreactor metagenome TaxID=1076179 RepID=A0A645IAK1_9ZZZZ
MVRSAWRPGHVAVAHFGIHKIVRQIILEDARHGRYPHVHQSDIHHLAFSCLLPVLQGGQNAKRRILCRHDVAD